jgi:membrane associated rhomboid family serine protease
VDGDADSVIGVAVAFIVIGLIFLFLIPWVGIAAGIVGLLLAILWIAGFGRRAATRDEVVDEHRA